MKCRYIKATLSIISSWNLSPCLGDQIHAKPSPFGAKLGCKIQILIHCRTYLPSTIERLNMNYLIHIWNMCFEEKMGGKTKAFWPNIHIWMHSWLHTWEIRKKAKVLWACSHRFWKGVNKSLMQQDWRERQFKHSHAKWKVQIFIHVRLTKVPSRC